MGRGSFNGGVVSTGVFWTNWRGKVTLMFPNGLELVRGLCRTNDDVELNHETARSSKHLCLTAKGGACTTCS